MNRSEASLQKVRRGIKHRSFQGRLFAQRLTQKGSVISVDRECTQQLLAYARSDRVTSVASSSLCELNGMLRGTLASESDHGTFRPSTQQQHRPPTSQFITYLGQVMQPQVLSYLSNVDDDHTCPTRLSELIYMRK